MADDAFVVGVQITEPISDAGAFKFGRKSDEVMEAKVGEPLVAAADKRFTSGPGHAASRLLSLELGTWP